MSWWRGSTVSTPTWSACKNVGDPSGNDSGAGLVTSCDLAFHQKITGRHASDHFGLIVEIFRPDDD